MQNYTSIIGASEFLDYDDPSTWNVTIKLERIPKNAVPTNQLLHLKFVSDPRINQYERTTEIEEAVNIKAKVDNLHPWTGKRLGIKAETLKPFDFRVLVGKNQSSEPAQRSSHICLSYNWWSDQWLEPGIDGFGLSPVLRHDAYHGKFDIPDRKFPIADTMWNAFLAERETESEGVWVDQLCIDQHDQAEVQNALLLMERIYKTARKVVVPLENVLLWSDEARAILKHIQAINDVPMEQRKSWLSWVRSANLHTLGASAYALFKIEGSRWFRRVWCNHEMRMGNDFVFLVPIMERTTPDDHAENVCIMKIDCKALYTLIASCRTMNIGTGLTHEDIMWYGYRKEVLIDFEIDQQPRMFMPAMALAPEFDKFTPIDEISRKAKGMKSNKRSVMLTLSQLTTYRTQHLKDVLHVLLDVTTPGLVYKDEQNTTSMAEIAFIINIVALASGDLSPLVAPTSLKFWQDNNITNLPQSMYSWAAFPPRHNMKWARGLNRLTEVPDIKITDLGLSLSVVVIGASWTMVQTQDMGISPERVSVGSEFIHNVLKFQRAVANRDRMTGLSEEGSVRAGSPSDKVVSIDPLYVRNYVDAMILCNQCGEDWIVNLAIELSQSGRFPKDIDISAQKKAFFSLNNSGEEVLCTFDYGDDAESEAYQRLLERWPECKDYIAFLDALVEYLIGPESAHKDQEIDESSRLSLVKSYSDDGIQWNQLLTLPSKQETGDYWLVRPRIIHDGARPGRSEHSGIDLRVGGAWAVKAVSMRSKVDCTVDVLDAERARKMSIWTNARSQEAEQRSDEVLELQMVSRSVRLFPAGKWQFPMFGKTAIVHG